MSIYSVASGDDVLQFDSYVVENLKDENLIVECQNRCPLILGLSVFHLAPGSTFESVKERLEELGYTAKIKKGLLAPHRP